MLRPDRIFFFLFPWPLAAMLVGNPAEPALETVGIFTAPTAWCSMRATFFEDYVYQQRFLDEFPIAESEHTKTFAKLTTQAGMLTLNFKNRIDLYGIAGASRFQLNQAIYSKTQFAWGCGTKLVIYGNDWLYIGADVKYFETNQKPLFFVDNGLAYNVIGDFQLKYHETQTSFGVCLRTKCIAPYIYGTYLIAKFAPDPLTVLVRWPLSNHLTDIDCKAVVTQRHLGMTVGATLLSGGKSSLSVESRMFNQNAIDVNMQLRF